MIKEDEGLFYIGDIHNPEAMIMFTETDIISVDHTYVSEALRGQGIAMQLLNKVIDYAKSKEKKILPVCSYAVNKLSKEEYKDIVVKGE
ncbi:MAG: GNAT family N-acetyltransferase [Bacilli bacterium]|nr:GNAT family N-acetyltransferase [Bacilli bacterium]